jgi:prepilin-type N-terminal cleavage/methylation domain-containing protein
MNRNATAHSATDARARGPAGFTLVELMVSLVLVLILMIGVAQVFRTTGDTVSAGQALSGTLRDARAAQAVIARDIGNMAPDGAFLIIRNRLQTAYRNPADQAADTDGSINTFSTGAGGGEVTTSQFLLNQRRHRVDSLVFFARDLFRRQTGGQSPAAGDNDPIVADQASLEACVHYGHLCLPHDNGNFYLSGATSGTKTNPGNGANRNENPNNYYASQWILGRVAILLVEPTGASSSSIGTITDRFGTQQMFLARGTSASATTMSPLNTGSATNVNMGGNPQIQDARVDLAGTSIDGFRTIVTNAIAAGLTTWWQNIQTITTRFEVNPFVARPITAATSSQQVPVFVAGCSKFVVEYAGDFVSQDTNGNVVNRFDSGVTVNNSGTDYGPTDGEIDYIVVGGRRQIRWYGMPRDTSSTGGGPDGVIRADQGDVVPLRDVINNITGVTSAVGAAAFEKEFPTTAAQTTSTDYAGVTPNGNFYTCAWSPSDTVRPRLIRIVMQVEDREGRINQPALHEFVVAVP